MTGAARTDVTRESAPGGPSRRHAGLLLTLVLAGMAMLGPFSIDTPFPAFAQMRGEFGVGVDEMQLVVSAYMLAFAVMTPFHGPLSDAVGRKLVYTYGFVASRWPPRPAGWRPRSGSW